MKKLSVLGFFAVLAVQCAAPGFSCTTMIVTKGASAEGSMFVAHSDDDELGDQRVVLVPSHKQVGARKIFAEHYRYPRINTDDRGPGYSTPGFPATPVLFELPYEAIFKLLGRVVAESYAYFDANYGIMNEANLMIGECTDGANYEPDPQPEARPGQPQRIFYTQELSRIALENCASAREAIKLMGALIDTFGYYSTGETLLVADADEAWVFEMSALPDQEHHSAWVAERVKDGEVFVAANEFRIRDVVRNDPDNFMFSPHLVPGLKKLGWWDEAKSGPIDWLRAVSPGEYNHPYYSLRRVWRILDRVNPDLGLSPWVADGYTRAYPFSVRPLHKLLPRDIFALYRDHYEGTQFDLTKGVAAGPYGDPTRLVGPYDGNQNDVSNDKKMKGAWERAISVFYQGYTQVCEVRPEKPEAVRGLFWLGPDVAYTTCFVPFYTRISQFPGAFQTGGPQKLSRESAWWMFNFVNDWSRLNFQRMTRTDILPLQRDIEEEEAARLATMDQAVAGMSPGDARKAITAFCEDNSKMVLDRWWNLIQTLITKYTEGYINLPDGSSSTPEVDKTIMIGYPSEWLTYTNYKDGPTSYEMK
jgi:dipeptidase